MLSSASSSSSSITTSASSRPNWWFSWLKGDIESLQQFLDKKEININEMFFRRNDIRYHVVIEDVLDKSNRHEMVSFFLRNGLSIKFIKLLGMSFPRLVFLKGTVDTVKVFVEFLYQRKNKFVHEVFPEALRCAASRADTSSVFDYLLGNLTATDLEHLMYLEETDLSRFIILMSMNSLRDDRNKDWISYHDCIHRLKAWLAARTFPDYRGLSFVCSSFLFDGYQLYIDVFIEAKTPLEHGLVASAFSKKWEITADLIRRGADVNVVVQTPSRNTILAYAIMHRAPISLISDILKAGANVNRQNSSGNSPVDMVQCTGVDPAIRELVLSFVAGQHRTAPFQ